MISIWWLLVALVSTYVLSYSLPVIKMIYEFKINERRYPEIAHDDPLTHYLVKKFAAMVLRYARVKYVVHGMRHRVHQNFVLVINHQSTFDGVIVNDMFVDDHIGGIIKDELYNLPFISFWLKARHLLPLNRKNNREGIKTMLQAIEYAKAGQPMFIFPEGTRSQSKRLLEFRDGAFKLAEKSESDISVMVIHNGYEHKFFKTITIHVELLPILRYEDYKGLSTVELSTRVRSMMQEALNRGIPRR
jgi:1-acyl-sn-glycerol-3-phosphate acyltransferase